MGSRENGADDQTAADDTPEDVAALYMWAKLQGAKYRDYSASRREYRSLLRYRATRELLEQQPQAELEEGASARLAVLALREEREFADAHSSAIRQAVVYEESEARRRRMVGARLRMHSLDEQLSQPTRKQGDHSDERNVDAQEDFLLDSDKLKILSAKVGVEGGLASGWSGMYLDSSLYADASLTTESEGEPQNTPAWLFPAHALASMKLASVTSPSSRAGSIADTLLESRERVASRWFALRGIVDRAEQEFPPMQLTPATGLGRIVAVYSLAGGVGKTSLVATLGRALAKQGESVALVESTSHDLLSIYFGSSAEKSATVNTLDPGNDAPALQVSVTAYDVAAVGDDELRREKMVDEILRAAEGKQRLLLDLSRGSEWLIRGLTANNLAILVPIIPDVNSVVSLQALERLFSGVAAKQGQVVQPFYVLNQFDASLPLHLDIRDIFRRLLGDRLLRVVIRRAEAVSEAMADGMTMLDYAPDAGVSQDYLEIANWLRNVSLPAAEKFGTGGS